MASHIERIDFHTDQFKKVIDSHPSDSQYVVHAFFKMQAAIMGKSEKNICLWATEETERLKAISLEVTSEED